MRAPFIVKSYGQIEVPETQIPADFDKVKLSVLKIALPKSTKKYFSLLLSLQTYLGKIPATAWRITILKLIWT
jgi:hypothetical protein